jgi:hypothetical protein
VDTVVETGTFQGDMVDALKDRAKTIYSIELSPEFYKRATHRFRAYPHIHILQGDSGVVLQQVLDKISGTCLFWLDGHFSGGETARGDMDTPIVREVESILNSDIKDPIILIDDARCFDENETGGYPSLERLRKWIETERPDFTFSVSNDLIRFHPKRDVRIDL